MAEFNINDKVRVKNTGEIGVVTDKMYSEAKQEYLYAIKPSDMGRSIIRKQSEIEPCLKRPQYSIETTIANNVVIGIIYEVKDGEKYEVCRGHGHIIHDGAEGIAQACSYAYRQALMQIDSGLYFKQKLS